MCNLTRSGWATAALLVSFANYAGDFEISRAWTRASAPGLDAAAVDMTITSKKSATLVGVSSPAAKAAELHSMSHEGGMMKMREVKSLELPAGKRVNLGESGYHLMLVGLKAPLEEGAAVPLTLNIKMADKSIVKIDIKVEVKSLTSPKPASDDDEHQHMHM